MKPWVWLTAAAIGIIGGIALLYLIVRQPEVAPGKAALFGKVVNANTGRPILNVVVKLEPYYTRTDRDGHYEFPEVEPGSHIVVFSKEGYREVTAEIILIAGQRGKLNIGMEPLPVPPVVTPTPPPLTEMERLMVFLAEHEFTHTYYYPYYICIDFSRDLYLDAMDAGFEVALVEIRFWPERVAHKINAFRIDGGVVFVEPQNHEILPDIVVGQEYPVSASHPFAGLIVSQILMRWSTQ